MCDVSGCSVSSACGLMKPFSSIISYLLTFKRCPLVTYTYVYATMLDSVTESVKKSPQEASTASTVEVLLWKHFRKAINIPVSYTHLRAHETVLDLVCR